MTMESAKIATSSRIYDAFAIKSEKQIGKWVTKRFRTTFMKNKFFGSGFMSSPQNVQVPYVCQEEVWGDERDEKRV